MLSSIQDEAWYDQVLYLSTRFPDLALVMVMYMDILTPLGNTVTLSHYVDANSYHDMTSGRSVTGILHLVKSDSH